MTAEEQQLSDLLTEYKRKKYPNVPDKAIPRTIINVKDANSLTNAILQTFEVYGLYAVRIQSQGQFDTRLGRFRKGTTRKGVSDLHCLLWGGQHCSLEVKYGKDKMSEAQRVTAQKVQASGGIYYIARDFASFWKWFHELKQKGQP